MLPQTQVERVIPKYRQFLRAYPSLRALAPADVADLRRLWYPLGYNIRPVRLHAIAARDGGALRRSPARRRRGAARAAWHRPVHGGRALSFAYGRDAAIPWTQRAPGAGPRLLGPRRLARVRGDRGFWMLAERLCRPVAATTSNQALMDFAPVVHAAQATLHRCPMLGFCATYRRSRRPMRR